ncbi:MAG: type II secretion system protein [Alphaproteobacteria bacterium]|nr:type II secretion system protein [Alphaproteobacteria bacterium]
MTILSRNDQKGRSMVEMLGVLAIIGVLSVGGISGYSKAMAKFKLTKAQDQLTMLLMNIRTAFATSPSYDGLSSQTAAEYNIAPNEMVAGTGNSTKLYSAFGGEVQIGTVGTAKTYFYIMLTNLGKEACRSLLTSDWGADGLISISSENKASGTAPANGSEACSSKVPTSDGAGTWCTKDLPVSLIEAGHTCSSEQNYITWIYY